MSRSIRVPARLSGTEAKRMMEDVLEEKVFRSQDGQVFKNLKELAAGLSNMPDEMYDRHVDASNNDFAIWVREVIGDEDTATNLEQTLNRLDAIKILEVRINYLNAIMST